MFLLMQDELLKLVQLEDVSISARPNLPEPSHFNLGTTSCSLISVILGHKGTRLKLCLERCKEFAAGKIFLCVRILEITE